MASEIEQHVDTETVGKRIGKSVLDHFTHISNDNEAKRIKNGTLLLQYLHKSNSDKHAVEITYALKRIIRGLGGSKQSSRIGFYSTLVALLHTFPLLTVDEILKCIQQNLQTEGSSSKSEAAEIYTGQILACGALIRSRKIFDCTKKEQEDVLDVLISAGKSRSYLSLASLRFISELITTSNEKQFGSFWTKLNSEVLKPLTHQTLDSLYLLLMVHKNFPGILKGAAVHKTLGTSEILSDNNLKSICSIVLNISAISALKHFLYPVLSEEIATSNIDLLFITKLDRHLIKSNRNKLMAASVIIRNALPHVQDSSKIPSFLPHNFVEQILQYYRNNRTNKNDDEFHQEISNLFDSLCNRLQKDDVEAKTKIKVLKKLIFYPGSFMFESITKSKNIQKIIRTLHKDGIEKLGSLYKNVLIMKKEKASENGTETWLNSERIYAAQLLTKLLNFPNVQNDLDWKIKNLKLLLDIAVLKNKYTNVGVELANNVREAFFRAVDLKFNKLENVASILMELTNHLQSELIEEHDKILRISLTEEEFQIFNQMHSTATKLEAKKAKDDYALVFQVLFLHMGLQLFDDKDLAVSSLNELFVCYERVAKKRKQKNEDDPEWIEVVVDLFLNLLSHNSLLLRNIVGSVFPYLCKYMTPSSIHQILSVLDPKNESNPLSQADESESEDENDNDDSDDHVDSESDQDENETVNDKLRMAVREALGNNGYQTDEESVDLDDMTEGDADKLDRALAHAFKQFRPNRGKSKKQTKQDETLTHFRIRVMDLLEIYLDSEPVMLSCLEMMLPLLQMLEFTIRDNHQKPLLMRVKHCVRKLSNVKKFSSLDGITDKVLGDFLNSLLEKGTKNSMLIQDMSSEISDCCVFVIKCSQADCLHSNSAQDEISNILKNALTVYFKQRDCLIPYYLFKSVVQLNWAGTQQLVPLVFNFVFNNEIRPFRRNQALELLKIFYLNRRLDGISEKFQKSIGKREKQFCDDLIETLNEFCLNPKAKPIKEKFICNIFHLLKAMFSHPRKNDDVDWKLIGEKIREFRSYVPLSRDAKSTYNQLCKQMHIPHTVQMKSQIVKFSNKNESDEELNKKQKQNSVIEIKKQKKDAKARRIQSMSEGIFSSCSFTQLNADEHGENKEETEVITNGIRKKTEHGQKDIRRKSFSGGALIRTNGDELSGCVKRGKRFSGENTELSVPDKKIKRTSS